MWHITFSFLHLYQIFAGTVLRSAFAGQTEAVTLIKEDGPCVLLQGSEGLCTHMLHRIFQLPGTDTLSLEDQFHKELPGFTILYKEEALHNAVIPAPDVLQRIGVSLYHMRYLKLTNT